MIPEIGHFALILCLALSIIQGVIPLVGAARSNGAMMATARPAAAANALFGTIAFVCLAYCFYQSDFTVLNVANNSNSMLPWYYKVAATWGSHEGSILFWSVTLGWWGAAVAFAARRLRKLFRLFKNSGDIRRYYKLGNPVASGNSSLFRRMVVKRNFDFAAVVAVHHAYFVCGRKSLLCCKTAARIYEARITYGKFKGYASGYDFCFACGNFYVFVKAGIKVRACGILTAVRGDASFFAELFDCNVHNKSLYNYIFAAKYAAQPVF